MLTHIFGVILDLNERIIRNHINLSLFAFIIVGEPLVDFVAKDQTEGAIQFREAVN